MQIIKRNWNLYNLRC